MLVRILKQAFAQKKPVMAATPPDVRAQWLAQVTALEREARRFCAAGVPKVALLSINTRLPRPANAADAQDLMRRVMLPVLEACLRNEDAATACEVEQIAYTSLIKIVEDPDHYEACFNLIDDAMHRLGAVTARRENVQQVDKPARKLLFFVHNLGQEFAHHVLLCDLLEAYLQNHPEEQENIGLIGATGGVPVPCVQRLLARWNIRVLQLAGHSTAYELYVNAAKSLAAEGFDRLVFVSVPYGLGFASGLLAPAQLGWLSMKFELSCFNHLQHRCSFVTGIRNKRVVRGRTWHAAAPFFHEVAEIRPSGQPIEALQKARRYRAVFYTINREEKIRNPDFLNIVADILDQVPDSAFVWTGRRQLLEIERFFEARNLKHRQFFAGWVVPDDLLEGGDIFLDTPKLSGTVAARAAVCGKPVVSMANSHSWINFFSAAHKAKGRSLPLDFDASIDMLAGDGLVLECSTPAQYVSQAMKLAQDALLRQAYASMLSQFANRYFFNGRQAAADHVANLRESR